MHGYMKIVVHQMTAEQKRNLKIIVRNYLKLIINDCLFEVHQMKDCFKSGLTSLLFLVLFPKYLNFVVD